MPYRLKDHEAVDNTLARIVEEQIDRAVAEIDDDALARPIAVH